MVLSKNSILQIMIVVQQFGRNENFVCILRMIGIYSLAIIILPHRLMVGQQILTLLIVVRIHVRQPDCTGLAKFFANP